MAPPEWWALTSFSSLCWRRGWWGRKPSLMGQVWVITLRIFVNRDRSVDHSRSLIEKRDCSLEVNLKIQRAGCFEIWGKLTCWSGFSCYQSRCHPCSNEERNAASGGEITLWLFSYFTSSPSPSFYWWSPVWGTLIGEFITWRMKMDLLQGCVIGSLWNEQWSEAESNLRLGQSYCCWRRLLRAPWAARRSNQSVLKEINPEYSLEGLMLKLKLQYFGHLMQRADIGKSSDAGKDWGQEEKRMIEDEVVGWHHQLDGQEFEQAPGDGDGQRGLARCSSWGCKELDATWRLNDNNNCCWGAGRTRETNWMGKIYFVPMGSFSVVSPRVEMLL